MTSRIGKCRQKSTRAAPVSSSALPQAPAHSTSASQRVRGRVRAQGKARKKCHEQSLYQRISRHHLIREFVGEFAQKEKLERNAMSSACIIIGSAKRERGGGGGGGGG